MENLKIRCRSCGKELEGHHVKTITCGCSNMTTIRGDKISALDLSNVVMLNSPTNKTKNQYLTNEDIQKLENQTPQQIESYLAQLFNIDDYNIELKNATDN